MSFYISTEAGRAAHCIFPHANSTIEVHATHVLLGICIKHKGVFTVEGITTGVKSAIGIVANGGSPVISNDKSNLGNNILTYLCDNVHKLVNDLHQKGFVMIIS